MRKNKQFKQNKRNQLFKYIQPSQPVKNHTKSLAQFQPNMRYLPAARIHNKENHHSSLTNNDSKAMQNCKSSSLKKFLSIFGNTNSNPVLQSVGDTTRREEKSSGRHSGRQVFTCNIKNMNVNMSHSKERQSSEYRTLAVRKQTSQQRFQNKNNEQQLIKKLRKEIQGYKQRQTQLQKQKATLQCQNAALKSQTNETIKERQLIQQRFLFRQRQMQRKIQGLQKTLKKQRCRQHQLVIQSLKKVINQQLRKIIQLQKFKIQRQQIQKLQERINKNITDHSLQDSQKKMKLLQTASIQLHKKGYGHIKIDDCATPSQSDSGCDGCQPIQEASQAQQQSARKTQEEGDSILQEVDRYLIEWKNKK